MTFKEYYQYYLSFHQNKWCRRMHILGQFATIVYVVGVITTQMWWFLLLAPFVIYPFAWTGHIVFEKNKPLAWKGIEDYGVTTLKAKVCDWIMLKDMLTGKLK